MIENSGYIVIYIIKNMEDETFIPFFYKNMQQTSVVYSYLDTCTFNYADIKIIMFSVV